MKTSNKLFVAACVVLVAALTFYNTALRAEYRKGTFRDPFKQFVTLSNKEFDAIDVEAGNLMSVRIEPGPYSVRVFEPVQEALQVRQQGRRLTLALRFPHDSHSYARFSDQPTVVITCPNLTALRTNATYSANGKPATDHQQPFYNASPVLVRGFRQDSLLVQEENGSRVELLGNTLHTLLVTAGHQDKEGAPVLRLHANNQIQQATLAMGGKSHLLLDQLTIPTLQYQFSDSATATLPGRMLNSQVQ